MNVIFISQCHKNALKETRRVLDQFAERIGERTWQTSITSAGLSTVRTLLRKTARKNTAVACHWVRGKNRTELVWIVGNALQFNESGAVPTNRTERKILRSGSENDWLSGEVIKLLTSLAALFHDLGKSCLAFQDCLKSPKPTRSIVRHEWLSVLMLCSFIGVDSDEEWLSRLVKGETAFPEELEIKQNILPFSDLPPLASAVCWLVVSHHRVPLDYNAYNDMGNLPEAINAEWCRSGFKNREEIENYYKFPYGTPSGSEKWKKAVAKAAKKTLEYKGILTANLFDPYIINVSRIVITLGDHIYSSLKGSIDRIPGDTDFPLYANTDRKTGKVCQKLDEHLLGVHKFCGRIMHGLPLLRTTLPSLGRHSLMAGRSRTAKFKWQDKAFDTASSVRAVTEQGGFFGINMASTGCGKTIANAKIMYALANPAYGARISVALGLRTLTLQTRDEYGSMLQLDDSALAVLVGGKAVKELYRLNMEDAFSSSESADGLLPENSYVFYEGSRDDSPVGDWLKNTHGGEKLVNAPVLTCTIDHLISASEGTAGGRQIAPMLRLMTSDLVLDEPDDYSIDDMYACSRLIYFAGLLGSRVLLSSATVAPSIAEGFFKAYSAGREIYNRNRGEARSRGVVCGWFDEFGSQAHLDVTADSYAGLHTDFASKRAERLKKAEVRRRASILPIPEGSFSFRNLVEIVMETAKKLHGLNSFKDEKSEAEISVGLVRVANINNLVGLVKAFSSLDVGDDYAVHICCYHSRFPLVLRSEIEKNLDSLLKRGKGKVITENPVLRDAINSKIDKKHHIFMVFASPVAEVGRDHDYDWAIIEPSSMKSIIQIAGRVRRHRDGEWNETNIYILDKNINTMKGRSNAYCKPGFETSKHFMTKRTMQELLFNEQIEAVNAIPRIIESGRDNYADNLSDFEHKCLRDVLAEDKSSKVFTIAEFWQTKAFLSAYMQWRKPFRKQTGVNEEYILSYDGIDSLILQLHDDGSSENRDRDFIREDVDEERYFIKLNYEEIIEKLAERMGISEEECSMKFGSFSLIKNDNDLSRFAFNNYLGVYKDV